jgi:hypothetical protein
MVFVHDGCFCHVLFVHYKSPERIYRHDIFFISSTITFIKLPIPIIYKIINILLCRMKFFITIQSVRVQ